MFLLCTEHRILVFKKIDVTMDPISRGADEVISRGAKVSLGRSILRFRKFVSRETTNLTVACCLHDQGQ